MNQSNIKIIKYISQSCVKCKLLDKILKHLNIKDYEDLCLEDIGMEQLEKLGIMSFPTLVFEKDGEKKTLTGNILPQDITDILNEWG